MDKLITAFRKAMPAMVDELTATLIDEQIQPYASLERAQLRALATAVLTAVKQDLETGGTTHLSAYWEHVARLRAEQGGQVTEILKGVSVGERVMDTHMRAAFADDPEVRAWWAYRLHDILHQGIVESSSYAIIGLDLNGTILSWNAGAERLSGYTADEMLGRPVTLLLPPDRPNEVAHIHEKLKRGEPVEHFETVRLRKDGTRVDVSLTISPILDESGTPIGTLAIARDISARKHLEAQYLHIQKLDSLGRFVSAIAHDFNNLLAAIVGNAELGTEAIRSGDTARNELEEIRKIAGRAANLTRQLLAFARQQALDLQELNINDLILDMECMLRQLIGPQIDLSMSLAAECGRIKAYPGHIEQLLVNLVVNARDALPDGGTLTIATATAPYAQVMGGRGADRQPGQFVGIIVADTGSGMSDEVKRHLFEPFFTTKAPGKGVGLGLATCFGIVKQYGGSIWIYSAPGQGTTVNIYFPCIE